jgi:alpha-beta hydrolase superfamily lysophospholipase
MNVDASGSLGVVKTLPTTDAGFQLTLPDGAPLYVHRWLPPQPADWAVVIVHGMGEHGGRYARFAAALNAAGAAVYAMDLPGHGLTARRVEDRGHFADHDGWNYALGAVDSVRVYAATQHPHAPLFVFAHSMGAFLVQHYLVERGRGLAGVIYSATSGTMGPLRRVGLPLMRLQARLLGPRHPSELAMQLTFRRFNRQFAPNRTDYDWLSRDPAEVDIRVADPLTGFACTAQLWVDLLKAGANLRNPARLKRIPKRMPILMIAGTDDALSESGKGCELLARAYHQAGVHDVTVWTYRGGRHELLNDTCRNEVTADVLGWLHDHRVVASRRAAETA